MPNKTQPQRTRYPSSVAVANDLKSSGISRPAVLPLQRTPADVPAKKTASCQGNDKPDATDIRPFQLKPGYTGESQDGTEVVQRVLIYKGKRYRSTKDIADDKDAWRAYQDSKDERKNAKLTDPVSVYNLERGLAPHTDVGSTSGSTGASTSASTGMFVYEQGVVQQANHNEAYYKNYGFVPIPVEDEKIIWCATSNIDELLTTLSAIGIPIQLPDDVGRIREVGINVEQDGLQENDQEGEVYHYIGPALAWTTRVVTCTVLAIYHAQTQRSFLYHADGSSTQIFDLLETYLLSLGFETNSIPVGLDINVFTSKDSHENDQESFVNVIEHLKSFNLSPRKIIHVLPGDTIAVSGGGAAEHIPQPPNALLEIFRRFNDSLSDEDVESIRNILERTPEAVNVVTRGELVRLYKFLKSNQKNASFLERFINEDNSN